MNARSIAWARKRSLPKQVLLALLVALQTLLSGERVVTRRMDRKARTLDAENRDSHVMGHGVCTEGMRTVFREEWMLPPARYPFRGRMFMGPGNATIWRCVTVPC